MDLIIDANILMSALISTSGLTFELVFNDGIKLFAPEFLLEEVEKHRTEIVTKAEISEAEFGLFFTILSSRILFVPGNEFEEFMNKANEIAPDKNDAEYLALAQKMNCALWSNDKKLKEQTKIKVYSTNELKDVL